MKAEFRLRAIRRMRYTGGVVPTDSRHDEIEAMSEDHDFGARLVEAFMTRKAASRYGFSYVPELSNQPYAMIQRLKNADRKETANIFKEHLPSICDWNVYSLISRDGSPEDVVECIAMNRQARCQSTWPFSLLLYLWMFISLLTLLSR